MVTRTQMYKLARTHTHRTRVPTGPSYDEMVEYCRDPDSSGCDIDMLDKLRAQANTLKRTARSPEPVQWNDSIDAAVKANAPDM